jgi:hypothetical protein
VIRCITRVVSRRFSRARGEIRLRAHPRTKSHNRHPSGGTPQHPPLDPRPGAAPPHSACFFCRCVQGAGGPSLHLSSSHCAQSWPAGGSSSQVRLWGQGEVCGCGCTRPCAVPTATLFPSRTLVDLTIGAPLVAASAGWQTTWRMRMVRVGFLRGTSRPSQTRAHGLRPRSPGPTSLVSFRSRAFRAAPL